MVQGLTAVRWNPDDSLRSQSAETGAVVCLVIPLFCI